MRRARWVMLGALGLVVTVAAAYAAGAAKTGRVVTAEVVKAKEIQLVDDAGHIRAALDGPHGATTFAIVDERGALAAELQVLTDAGGQRTAHIRLAGGRGAAMTHIQLTAGPTSPEGKMVQVQPVSDRVPWRQRVLWQAP